MNLISVTNILTQSRPSAEFVTSLVEAFSQRVSSSPLLSNRGSVRLICNSFIANNATATLATQSVLETDFVNA